LIWHDKVFSASVDIEITASRRYPRRASLPIVVGGTDEKAERETDVDCQKGKPIRQATPGDFRCKECGFVPAKKQKLCEPKQVKK
jgi:hypothetical protein